MPVANLSSGKVSASSFLCLKMPPRLAIIFNTTDIQICTNKSGLLKLPKMNTKSETVLSAFNYFIFATECLFHKKGFCFLNLFSSFQQAMISLICRVSRIRRT
jgi:hypothetical protein